MIVIVAGIPAWGGSLHFYHVFKDQGFDTKYYLASKTDPTNMKNSEVWKRIPKEDIFYYDNISIYLDYWKENDAKIILFPMHPEKSKPIFKSFKGGISTFLTPSKYRKKFKLYHTKIDKYNIVPFAPPDSIRFSGNFENKNIMLLHPTEFDYIKPEKPTDKFVIVHAPGSSREGKIRSKRFGSKQIKDAIRIIKEKYPNIEYKTITDYDWEDGLKEKANAHILISAINTEYGGTGKNAFEGIALDCVVMTSINNWTYQESEFYPPHPILNIESKEDVVNILDDLLKDDMFQYKMYYEWTKWFKKFIGYENTFHYMKQFMF